MSSVHIFFFWKRGKLCGGWPCCKFQLVTRSLRARLQLTTERRAGNRKAWKEMGGGGEGSRDYSDIATNPLPSRGLGWAPPAEPRSQQVTTRSSGRVVSINVPPTTATKGYVLPPIDSKYDKALARHYEMKYPTSTQVGHDEYSKEWIDGNSTVQSQISHSQPFVRLKTPNCPWGIDSKVFRPADAVMSNIRLATSKPVSMKDRVRSHSSMAAGGDSPGKIVPQVIPGYTGHFTGLRDTYGKTYGHAELMLGRMSPVKPYP